ncbi:MAG: GGDEF and EAL domain-containing protein [Clostridia bacterium]|nr:GGDEF and EAL domain-containing protein [Clostridia bacterium]
METAVFSNPQIINWLFDSLEAVSDGGYVYICDLKTEYSKWSQDAVDVFGLQSTNVYRIVDYWSRIVHPDDLNLFLKTNEQIISGSSAAHDMTYRVRTTDGTYVMVASKGSVLHDTDGTPLYFCGTLMNHGIHSNVDEDTGLRNQYGFFEDLDKLVLVKNSLRLLLFGVSHFSEINELYGYMFGNRVLQEIARIMKDAAGTSGTVYRMEGAKFAVITRQASTEAVISSYTRLMNRFKSGLPVDGQRIPLTFSAGMLPIDDTTLLNRKTIYSCLHYAFYQSKGHANGELFVFNEDSTSRNNIRLRKLNAIRNSISDGCRGFFLCYQPIMDCQSETLHGAEALIRWQNDEFGIIYPDEFIEVIEQDALYDILGEWILRQAMTDGLDFIRQYPDFIMNVNLSYSQMEKKGFSDHVLSLLQELGYRPQNLCLEITERCRLGNIALLKSIVEVLRARGIRFALDDFGTGFSSLGILKEIPMDTVKIDRQFTKDVLLDKKTRKLIKHTAALASTFESDICAEGIETEGMRDLFQKYKIRTLQGYLYSKPIDKAAFTERFLTGTSASPQP